MLKARGEGGELAYAGRTLARLGAWQLESAHGEAEISAEVRAYDAYLLPRCRTGQAVLRCGQNTRRYAVSYEWDGHELRMRGGQVGNKQVRAD
jgi:hypothetical protein